MKPLSLQIQTFPQINKHPMKKTLLTITTIFIISFAIQAQTEKGKIFLSGVLGYSSKASNYDYYYSGYNGYVNGKSEKKETEFSIIPKFGYFLGNNFVLGLGVGYNIQTSYYKGDNNIFYSNYNTTTNSLVINPFGRYYIGVNEKFKFFGEVGAAFNFGTINYNNGSNLPYNSTSRQVNAYLNPGFAYFPTTKFSIELSVTGISYTDVYAPSYKNNIPLDYNNSSSWNIFGSSSSGNNLLNPKLGISFYF